MLHPNLEVRNIGVVSGNGLVACALIEAGELVWKPDPGYPLLSVRQLAELRAVGNKDYYSQVGSDSYARNSPMEWRFNKEAMAKI